MEDNTHYRISDTKQNGLKNYWKIVPIYKIILDKGMSQIAKEKCDDKCKNKDIKKFKNGGLIPMIKWDKVYTDFMSKKPLDPIIVSKYKDTGYYEVIDGRHRCIISYVFGYTTIPIHLFEDL